MVHPCENLLPKDILTHLCHPTKVTASLYNVILNTIIPISYTLKLPDKSTIITHNNL